MDTSQNSVRGTGIVFNLGFAVAAVLGLAFTAFMISDSWGGGYAVFDAAVAVVVCLLALARTVNRTWTALAGVVVVAVAILVSQIADLPQEPGPVTSLALAVLIGSAIRYLPAPLAGGIAGGGLLVTLACWLSGGFKAVAVASTLAWLGAVVIGWSTRQYDAGRRTAVGHRPATALGHADWPHDQTRTS